MSRTIDGSRTGRSLAAGLLAGILVLGLSACDEGEQSAGSMNGPGATPTTSQDDDTSTESGSHSDVQAVQQCLGGDWEIDRSSEFWDIPAGEADEVTGTVYVVFSADGEFRMIFEQWYIYVDNGAEIGNYVETTWNGTLSGEYVVDEGGFAVVEVTDSSAKIDTVIAFGKNIEEETTRVEDQPVPLVFTCDSDRLLGFPVADQDRSEPFAVYDRTNRG